MLKRIARRVVQSLGYEIIKKDARDILFPSDCEGYDDEEEARVQILRVRKRTMVAYRSLTTLWNQVRYCEDKRIPGAFVECGVWKGGAVGLMALANFAYGSERRHLHLFDAFDDICEPDPEVDGEKAISEAARMSGVSRAEITGRLEPLKGIYEQLGGAGDLDKVRRFLEQELGYDSARLHYHVGWFQHTMPSVGIDRIAILRLDADWYRSTKCALDSLYKKVVPGGVIIVDDYGCYEGCRKAVDEFLEGRFKDQFESRLAISCWKS